MMHFLHRAFWRKDANEVKTYQKIEPALAKNKTGVRKKRGLT